MKKGLIIGVIAVLAILAIWSITERSKWKTKAENVEKEVIAAMETKDSLSGELKNLYSEYEYLKINNDTLKHQMSTQQTRIEKMMKEIKGLRGANSEELKKYKSEVETLKKIIKHFVVQLDSLNTQNQSLTSENRKIKTDFNRAVRNNEQLSQKNDSLKGTIDKAAELRAENIAVEGLNRSDKPTKKADKLYKIQVCFDLPENKFTKAGQRTVYIRIAQPNGEVVAKETDLFTFEGKPIGFSSKRSVDYKNEKLQNCIYWTNDQNEDIQSGNFAVDLFMDGKLIGTKIFEIK